MDFRILGPLEVHQTGGPVALGGTKQRALLAILLLNANKVVSSDRLIDELWGEEPPETAAKGLQGYVSALRKALDPKRERGGASEVLVTRPPGYAIQVEPEQLDLSRFERLRGEARDALAAGDPAQAGAVLREALALWRGQPLADFAYASFAQTEIDRLEELRLGALEERIEADLALARHADVASELEGLIYQHPLRERLRGQLILALYRSGRQAEALQAYRDARHALTEELGIEPSRELRELEQAILTQDPALDFVVPAASPPRGEPEGVEPRGAGAFVGRERELGELVASLEAALSGSGRLVLLGGEAGIGKSRLAGELALHAEERGARVLVGRCWEAGGAPAYWPWVQSLRSYLRSSGAEEVREALGSGAPDIAQVLPEVGEFFPDLSSPPSLEAEGARFRLFDAAATFLRKAASVKPLVFVFDDLHAADTPSLLMLQFVAGELGDARILIIGAYRDIELRSDHPLVSTLAELQRHETTRRLPLGGLTELDVSRFIELAADLHPAEALAAAIHDQTDGNPLFVDEVVKLLAAEGRLGDAGRTGARTPTIPQSVREVIARRLHGLPEECTDVLTLAAVLGRDFTLDALGRISELKGDQLLRVLDEAITARVVTEVPGSRGRLRFSHALIRDVLYDGLPPGRRAQIHREIGEALEAMYARDPEPFLTELCHHFFEALPGGEAAKALAYARRAGDRAGESLAYEEAVRLYGLALQVLELEHPIDDAACCDVVLKMGDAQMRVGDAPGAKESFWRAAEIARHASMPEQLARAALGYGGRFVWSRASSDRRIVSLLEEALVAVGDGDSAIRVRLLARLAGALRDAPFRERAASLSEEAVEVARRLEDPATLAYALDAMHIVIWGPDRGEERAAIAAEILQLANAVSDRERAFEARFWRLETLLDAGDVQGMRAELEEATQLAEDLKQPAQLWYVAVARAQLALFEGRFEVAEDLVEQALSRGQKAQSWEALVYYRIQIFGLRSAQGRLEELEETIRHSVDEYPSYGVFRCVLASLYRELEREAECRLVFQGLAADDFAGLPRDEEWLFAMTLLTPVSAFLGDSLRSELLYELLSPYADRNAVSVPDLSTGSVSRSLGILATTMRMWDRAADHFEGALAINSRMGARPWLAHTQHDYAGMLLSRDGPADREKAQELLAGAVETYRQLDMGTWADRAAAAQP